MPAYGKHSPDSHQVSHISRATKANFLHFYLLIESRPLQTKCWSGKQFALLSKKHRALGLYGERNKDLCIIRSTSRRYQRTIFLVQALRKLHAVRQSQHAPCQHLDVFGAEI